MSKYLSKTELIGIEEATNYNRHNLRNGTPAGETRVVPDLRTVLNTALSQRWQKFVREVERGRSNPTEKAVHDMRVAMRRLISLLEMVGSALPKSGGTQVRKQLRKHLKSLSDLRDIQVQILAVREMQSEHPELPAFLGELYVREASQTKRARKEIQRIDTDPVRDHIARLSTNLDKRLVTPTMNDASVLILLGMLAETYIEAAGVKEEIAGSANDPESLHELCRNIHRLRLIFKRFRYVVEILRPLLPRVSGRMLKSMSDYQSKMGAIHDTEVLIESISLHAKHARRLRPEAGSSPAEPLAPIISQLKGRLKQESDEFLLMIDELDDYWKHIIEKQRTKRPDGVIHTQTQ